MTTEYVNITMDNVDEEHLCCAISDKKHQVGVGCKKSWLKERLPEGHVFRKLNAKGKVFIEYSPLEKAWTPVEGENYMYIYCLWVSGSFKGKGHANDLLQYCIEDAKKQGKSGICIISAKKKKPYMSDPKFFKKYGFEVVDQIGEYQLLALSFDGTKPEFTQATKSMHTDSNNITIYYGQQCPFIPNCIEQVKTYCDDADIDLKLIEVDSLEKAKAVPGIFNNWALFKDGEYMTNHLLNESYFKKMILNKK